MVLMPTSFRLMERRAQRRRQMASMSGFFVHAAWVLTLAGVTGGVFYWLMSRVLGRAAEPPDAARHRLDDLPADRKN